MNVGELCNREVVFAHRETSLIEAARLMREHHVGSLVAEEMDGFVRTLRSVRARETRVRR